MRVLGNVSGGAHTVQMARARHNLPPGPGRIASARILGGFLNDPIASLEMLRDRWGDVVMVRSEPFTLVPIFDPNLVTEVLVTRGSSFVKGRTWRVIKPLLGEGLFTSEGEIHLRQRRMCQPAFQPRHLEPYAQVMTEHTLDMIDSWNQRSSFVDMHQQVTDLTLRIAGLTMFGRDMSSAEAGRFGAASEDAIAYYRQAVLPGSGMLLHLPLPGSRRFKRARAHIDDTIYGIINDRDHADTERRGDLLTLLRSARDAEGDGTGMNDRQLRDECVTALIAGHETVANSLTFTLWLLASHPEHLERVREEIRSVIGEDIPTYKHAEELACLRAVISESLRLYPPGYVTVREAVHDVTLGSWHIPAGAEISIPISLIQRDPRWWDSPDEFRPERFMGETAKRPRHAYLPFGSGRRVCIGQAFAWLEMLLVLATLLPRWNLEIEPGFEMDVDALFTLRPKHGLPMRITPR